MNLGWLKCDKGSMMSSIFSKSHHVTSISTSYHFGEQPEMKNFDDDQIELVMEDRRERLGMVKENILNAQKKQKELYDRKHSKPEVFSIGMSK